MEWLVRVVFDTNILIDYLKGIAAAKTELALFSTRCISRLSWMEVLIGASKQDAPHIRSFLDTFVMVEMDSKVCEKAIELRAKNRLKLPDALVLATAHVQECQLSTRNTRDFGAPSERIRVPYKI